LGAAVTLIALAGFASGRIDRFLRKSSRHGNALRR